MEFLDRKRKISELKRVLSLARASKLIVIYVRRKLGKSTLIRKIISQEDIYYITGDFVLTVQIMGLSVGEHKDLNIKPIRILNNGYRAKSLVKYGLEEIADILSRPWRKPDFLSLNFCHLVNKFYLMIVFAMVGSH